MLSESRKYQGCPILGTQTKSQITKIYGKEDTSTILQGTKTKLILGCIDPETARAMADIIGRQEYIYLAENYSRSHHSGRGGSGKTVSLNEQFRDSHAVLPEDIMGLPDLVGYLKIAQYCILVELTHRKFPHRHQRFIPLSDSKRNPRDIKDQWSDLNFDE